MNPAIERSEPQMERGESQFERTFNVTGPVALDISLRAGRIRVRRGAERSVTIRGVVRARPSLFNWIHPDESVDRLAAHPPFFQDGNTFRIGDVADRWLLRRVFLFLDVIAPPATTLRALGDHADIRVERIAGPVHCETDSGNIEITGIAGRVSAASESGSISVQGASGPIDVKTDSGDIEALDIAAGIDAVSDDGRIRLSQTKPAPIYAQSDTGRIAIRLAPQGGYTLRIRSTDGPIEIPGLARARTSRHETEGAIRGGGSIVAIETGSGDIEIQ